MLTRADIATINKARVVARKLESESEFCKQRDYPLGRLAEACRAADDALLNLLIVAKVHEFGVTDQDMRPF